LENPGLIYKHALFLNPYIESNANSTMKLFPPVGLEYVATSAKGLAEKITLLDLRHEEELSRPDKLLDFIRRDVDIVCAAIGWDRQLKEICALLELIPAGVRVVVGGYTATEKAEELFRDCPRIDIIVRGEGEETIKEILIGLPLENILGLSYRKNGAVVHNANRPLPGVDAIAFPDRALRHNEYHLMLNGINVMNLKFDAVLSARGCPHNCKFCTFSLNPLGQKRNYAPRSSQSVADEIEGLAAKVVLFSDDNFFANPARAEEICDLIIARKIKKRFIAQARLEVSRYPSLLKKMVKAGFKVLLIGIESPHDRILAQMNKGFTSAMVRKAFSVLKKYPIYYHGYFIYGNIGETEEEMLYISQFAKEIGVDSITLNKLRIEKFSPLKALAEKTPGYHVTESGALYSDEFPHSRLKKIGRKLRFSFYTPSRFMKMLGKNIFVVRFFTPWEVAQLIIMFPRLIYSAINREIQRGRLADSLKRTFVSNR